MVHNFLLVTRWAEAKKSQKKRKKERSKNLSSPLSTRSLHSLRLCTQPSHNPQPQRLCVVAALPPVLVMCLHNNSTSAVSVIRVTFSSLCLQEYHIYVTPHCLRHSKAPNLTICGHKLDLRLICFVLTSF